MVSAENNSSTYRGLLDTSQDERVLVLDFGGQTAQLIARRIRDHNVLCQVVRHDLSADAYSRAQAPRADPLRRAGQCLRGRARPQFDPEIFELNIPVLGICYGMHVACRALGSEVKPGTSREFGRTTCRIREHDGLFHRVPDQMTVWMNHGDQVDDLSANFDSLAATDTCPFAAVRHRERPIYGLQFHPEVTHTEHGSELLGNFVRRICGCSGSWELSSLIDREVESIRARVGPNRVICGLSGGVDSSVTAALLYRAIGPQLSCIFVDNGLLRKDEAEEVKNRFTHHFKTDLHVVDARERFLSALAGVTRPADETKDHRPRLHRSLPQRSPLDSERQIPGAGDCLSRRHRIRSQPRRAGCDDQGASQRGRTAGRAGFRADRALAGPVQGRGPQNGTGTRACPKN